MVKFCVCIRICPHGMHVCFHAIQRSDCKINDRFKQSLKEQQCYFFPSSHTLFLDNHSQLRDLPRSHIALDRHRAGPSASRDVEPTIIVPYFPHGLPTSPENITDFNFTFFLYDSLQLPSGLFRSDLSHEVEFADLQECREYCAQFVAEKEEW